MPTTPKKIKVLFVITKSNWGGAQKYVYDIATWLPRDKFDVVVALGGEGGVSDKLHTASIRIISLPTLKRDINPLKDFSSFVSLVKLFKTERPDVVHLNSAKAAGLGALASRLVGVPKIIFTAHGWAFNEERSWFSRNVIKLISWMTVLLAHKTIAVSDAVFRDMQWLGAPNKIVVIKNGIRPIDFLVPAMARTLLSEFANTEFPTNAFFIGTISELHKNKGLPYAIEAFAGLHRDNPLLYYFILGEGEEKERLNTLALHHGLHGRVFLLGFVEDASRLLMGFDVFVLPSTKEGLPMVLLEAGLAKLPIIATNVGGIPEIIENMKTGILVKPRNSKALSEALGRLIASPSLCDNLGKNLKVEVSSRFSFERTIAETTKLYTTK